MSSDITFGQYRYQAQLKRVVDGDTLDLVVDLGFGVHSSQRFRLVDIDTAETYGVTHSSEEYARGTAHQRYVRGWLSDATREHEDEWPFVIDSQKDSTGAYGRFLVQLWRKSDGRSLSRSLLEEFGEEVRYDP